MLSSQTKLKSSVYKLLRTSLTVFKVVASQDRIKNQNAILIKTL